MGESEYHTLPISFNPISEFADVVSEKNRSLKLLVPLDKALHDILSQNLRRIAYWPLTLLR